MPEYDLTIKQVFLKRVFDIIASLGGIVIGGWLALLGLFVASFDTKSFGLFIQKRVGKDGVVFNIFKLKTMLPMSGMNSTVTCHADPRITPIGKKLRKYKIDELPQLVNVLIGDMSFVGPRPDVPGFLDHIEGNDRCLLKLRPGITGLATLHFKYEEQILEQVDDPESFNRDVVFPLKIYLNKKYLESYSFKNDIDIILQTIFGTSVCSTPIQPYQTPNDCVQALATMGNLK